MGIGRGRGGEGGVTIGEGEKVGGRGGEGWPGGQTAASAGGGGGISLLDIN